MKAIHQLASGFTRGDAISNEVAVLRGLFRSWGFESRIFCEPHRVLPELRAETADAALAPALARPDDVFVLHLSIGSAVNDIFARLKCRRVIVYHNMTPAGFFRGINERVVRDLEWGRGQARDLAGQADLVTAVSRFNAAELESMGYRGVRVFPLVLDFAGIRAKPDRAVLRRMSDGRANILFVGRGAPNKRIEDLLCAFHYYLGTVSRDARLIHVGSYTGMERYQALVRALARRLEIQDSVLFANSVSQAELSAYYHAARAFLCMSEHEGFCIPLIESMVHGVPVVAYAAGAVPETLAGAGVLFSGKRWDFVAETLSRVCGDAGLRQKIILGQAARARAYEQRDLKTELRSLLAPLLEG